jgi:hypothetical protein
MVWIYQPPNAHVRNPRILLSNAMAAAAVKKIYVVEDLQIYPRYGIKSLTGNTVGLRFMTF